MKRIFLCHASNNLHAIYKNMIKDPPKGFVFILPKISTRHFFISYLQNSKRLKKIYNLTLKKIIKSPSFYSNYIYSPPPINTDLVLAFGTSIPEDIPYVMDLPENPFSTSGYNFSLFKKNLSEINKNLSKPNCRAIIYPFEDCKKLCSKYFNKKVMEKFVLVRFALPPRKKVNRDNSLVRFLFVGSLSNPDDFEIKGGVETIESFLKLRREFGSKVELIIRCYVPSWVYNKYSLEGITIINTALRQEELDKLFLSSHVLFVPSHSAVAMTPIEGMSFSMPLIGLDIYGAREYIKNNKNGFLIKPSRKVPYNSPNYPCNVRSKDFLKNIRNSDSRVIEDIYLKIRKLVVNPLLLKKMSNNSLNLLKKNFNIRKRKELLAKVFEEAIKSSQPA